ncbi:hypothetical protein HKCCE3408_12305 [Rhodobacterales bacterium HKCCE3408]|nr:hypothetical protein [Rhodobacterales bacterium HKCCE3408]
MTPITLHIGMNKTGTSALQRFMHRNRRPLARAGLIYPETGLGTRTEGAGLHYRLSRSFLDDRPEASEMVERLLDEIDRSGAERAIVSSEFLVELKDVAPLATAFANRSVEVLVYLRRHDHWVASAFAQAVKTTPHPPWKPDVDAFIVHLRNRCGHYYRYGDLLGRWAEAFGPDRLRVRVYGPGGATDIVADVLGRFGLDRAAIPKLRPEDSARVNIAPSRRQLAAIDHVQRAPMPAPDKALLVRRLLSVEDQGRTRRLMTAATARALLDENAEDYAEIARHYLGRADGVLFDEPPPEPGGPDRIALWPGEAITLMTELLAETMRLDA